MSLEMKFTVRVRDQAGKLKKISIDLKKEANINRVKLNTELSEQPGRYAWVATLAELARLQKDEAEADVKKTAAELDMYYRSHGIEGLEKVTETAIGHAIQVDEDYRKILNKAFIARRDYGLLIAAREVLSQRKDMLMSLSANQRLEYQQA